MERALASIRTVSSVQPIPNSDFLELATVDGWQCVVSKGEFTSGDLCCYIEIDSFLPICDEFEFLRKACHRTVEGLGEGFRIRTIKLRGQLSQGLAMPLAKFGDKLTSFAVGDDVTTVLGIVKYDPPVGASLSGMARGFFPSFIPKTDQERAQNIAGKIFSTGLVDATYEITLKMEGSSGTFYKYGDDHGVCSRNLNLKLLPENEGNTFVHLYYDSGLYDALQRLNRNIAVQGEVMGPGIQGNIEKLTKPQLFVFAVYDIDAQRYLQPAERYEVCAQLAAHGFTGDHVPILAQSSRLPATNLADLLKYADGPSMVASRREGLVYKHTDSEFSFKTISNAYLLATDG